MAVWEGAAAGRRAPARPNVRAAVAWGQPSVKLCARRAPRPIAARPLASPAAHIATREAQLYLTDACGSSA